MPKTGSVWAGLKPASPAQLVLAHGSGQSQFLMAAHETIVRKIGGLRVHVTSKHCGRFTFF
jgi:hypothetical protein